MNIYDPIAIALGIQPSIDIKDYPTLQELLSENPPTNISEFERISALRQWADPEMRKHMISGMKAKYDDPEYRQKIQDRVHSNPEVIAIRSKACAKMISNPETKQKIRKTQSNPEWKKWFKEEIMNAPEIKQACSERAKKQWANSEHRALKSKMTSNQLNNAPTFYCEQCDRSIKNEGNWALHLKSKKHAQFSCQ
jgi:hypothetical protein